MTILSFPTPTYQGQTFLAQNGIIYTWDGEKWTVEGAQVGGTGYILPPASNSRLGGVKVGTNINVDGNGVISIPNQTQVDWSEDNATSIDYIKNKPTDLGDFTNNAEYALLTDLTWNNIASPPNFAVLPLNTAGYLYNNGSGTLSWSTPAGGGATSVETLSDVAVNLSTLVPEQTLVYDGMFWVNGYTDKLSKNGHTLSLDTNGTLTLPVPTPRTFTALLLPVYGGAPDIGPYGGNAWEIGITFDANADGTVSTLVDNIFPIPDNPGYKSGDSWTFHEADHGIPGYTFTLTLGNVVYPGGAGWTANIAVSPPPTYPSTINSVDAIKLTSNENSWTFGTDGNLTLPVGGDILDSNGTSVLGGGGGTIWTNDANGCLRVELSSTGFQAFTDGTHVDLQDSGTWNIGSYQTNTTISNDGFANPHDLWLRSGSATFITTDLDSGPGNQWMFSGGSLTFPNGTTIGDKSGTGTLSHGPAVDTSNINSVIGTFPGLDFSSPNGVARGWLVNGPGVTNATILGIDAINGFIEIDGGAFQVGQSYTFTGTSSISIGTKITVNSNDWIFGTDGKLTLPNGQSIGSGSLDGIKMTTDRGTVLFGNSPECLPTLLTHFHIMKEDASAVDLFLGDDINYVKLPGNGETAYGVEIGTNVGDGANTWRFGTDGTLTVPGDIHSDAGLSITVGDHPVVADIAVDSIDEYPGAWRLFISDILYPDLGTTVTAGATVTASWGSEITANVTDNIHDAGSGWWVVMIDQDLRPSFSHLATVTFGGVDKTWQFGLDGNLTLPNGMTIDSYGTLGVNAFVNIGGDNTRISIDNNGAPPGLYITTDAAGTPKGWLFDSDGNLTLPDNSRLNSGGIDVRNSAEIKTTVNRDGGDSSIINTSEIALQAGNGGISARVFGPWTGGADGSGGPTLVYAGVENLAFSGNGPGFAGFVAIDPAVTSNYSVAIDDNSKIFVNFYDPVTTTGYVAALGVLTSDIDTGTGKALLNGIAVTSTQTALTGNAGTSISTDGGTWTFGADGTTTVPGKIWAKASDNGSISFSDNGVDEHGYIKVDAGLNMVINADGDFYIKKSGSDRISITTNAIQFTAGGKSLSIGNDGRVTLPENFFFADIHGSTILNKLSYFTNDLEIDANTLTGTTLPSNVTGSSLTSVGQLTSLTSSGVVHITNTEESINANTGSLQVDGGVHIAKNLIAEGTIYAGVDAYSEVLTNPLLVASSPSGVEGGYSQVAILNNTAEASGDFQVMIDGYDVAVSDTGWSDLGMAGSNFSDARYTITQPGDGYVFVSGKANSTNGGSLVLATDGSGTTNDIVFATGGFTTDKERMRISDADGSITITGELKSTAGTGDVVIEANDGTARIWTFGADGLLTFPGAEGFQATFGDVFPVGNVLQTVNNLVLSSESEVCIRTDSADTAPQWTFGGDGALTLPAGGDIKDSSGNSVFASTYTLPTASDTVLGGVKVDGTTITITDGVISSTGGTGGYSLPTASTSTLGGVKVDGSTITINGSGVVSAVLPTNISHFTNDSGYLTSVTTITGNAGTATKLATARNINGVAFDGTGDITVTAAASTLTGNTLNSGITGSSLTSVGTLTNLTVTNAISGSVTGSAGSVAGSAITGTTLASGITTSSLTSVGTLANLTVTNPIVGTVQNGVVTTGSYANPAWITSLANSKITGLAASATTDTTSATNITSGTLPNARLSAVPNSALANSSVTIGTTAIALGASSTTLAGLTGVTSSGNIAVTGSGKFSGDGSLLTNVTVSNASNIVGTGTNVNLVAGSYTYLFDNAGILTLPSQSITTGSEGAEIDFTKAPNSTLSGSVVVVDQYADRLRFFEGGGTNRGVYIDLTQAATSVGTLLNNRVSGLVNAGTFVTMDLIKATVTTSGNRGLSLATTTGTLTYNIGGTWALSNSTGGGASLNAQTLTTTATASIFGWSFGSAGDMQTYILTDTTNSRCYRITLMIGTSYNNNMICIERLV